MRRKNKMERLITIGEAERKVKEYVQEENDDALYDLIQEVLFQDKIIGSAGDFHNLALNFSRRDDYETACNILDKGLNLFPRAVDLLADYLQNGINCDRTKLCEEYFNRLLNIPMMRWTWRGFSFSIDYMKNYSDNVETEEELLDWRGRMFDMAENYYKYFPDNEDTFLVKADIYQYFNDKGNEIKILEKALQELKSCPRCSLRLADIYFDKGEYDKALNYIGRCKFGAVQTQEKINQGYMYYLSGLCKAAQTHQSSIYDNEEVIKDIYTDFSIAEKLKMSFSSYKKVMERQIYILESKSGILYDTVIA